jgi:CBS domain-containing protein
MAHPAHPDPHETDLDELEFDQDPDFEGHRPPSPGRRRERRKVFDDALLRESVKALPVRKPIVLSGDASVTDAVRAMQHDHRGAVAITEDGTPSTRLVGIFTERDVLLRIVERGRNPAVLRLSEVMTHDPERLPLESSVAWALNKMSIGGFRHVPVVDDEDRPVFVVSVRDVVELLVEAFPGEVLNLPVEYGADRQRTREGA